MDSHSEIPQLPLREYGIGGEPRHPLTVREPSALSRSVPLPIRGSRSTESSWRTWGKRAESSSSDSPHTTSLPARVSPRTYVVHGPLPSDIFDTIRVALPGWRPASKTAADTDFFICVSGGGRGWFDNVSSRLKCRLNAPMLTDKFVMHMALEGTTLIAPTQRINRYTTMPDGAVWMIRANWGDGGSASGAVDSTAAMLETVASWSGSSQRRRVQTRVMASEYIREPLLHDGCKFHVRAYVVCAVVKSKRYYNVAPTMEIVQARMPWPAELANPDWSNDDVHITTVSAGNLNAREDAPILRAAVLAVLDGVMTMLLPHVEPYPESPNAYEAYAVDFMFHADGRAIIIDINSTPRMYGRTDTVGRELVEIILAGPYRDVFCA